MNIETIVVSVVVPYADRWDIENNIHGKVFNSMDELKEKVNSYLDTKEMEKDDYETEDVVDYYPLDHLIESLNWEDYPTDSWIGVATIIK